MTWIRLAVLTMFALAVAGCGGDSVSLEPGTAVPQARMTDETDGEPAALDGAASTVLLHDLPV